MTQQHTPGPWWLDDDGFIAAGQGDDYVTVADPHCSDIDPDERESNARLIAAAPELLEALRAAKAHMDWITDDTRRKWSQRDQTTYEIVEAAIDEAVAGA